MVIKHLVISGGGQTLFQSFGAYQYLTEKNYIIPNKLESIYGTSAGAMLGTLICLNKENDWETINNYLINRPWHKLYNINLHNLLSVFNNKGMFDSKIFEASLKPLFDIKNVPIDINLYDFYNYCKIEMHFITFDINEYKTYDISYINYPRISLLKALQMTCGLPPLIEPVMIEDKCFIDGGIECNYPLKYCIESKKEKNDILGFKNLYENQCEKIKEDSTLIEYISLLILKAIFSINKDDKQEKIENEICLNTKRISFETLNEVLISKEKRKELFENGKETATRFLCGR